jgi:uncharacterized protein
MENRRRTTLESRPLPVLAFFLLAFAITWAFWLPSALVEAEAPVLPFGPGLYGPSIAAIVVLLVVGGRRAVGHLLRGLLLWRISWRWYAFIVGFPVVLAGFAWLGDWVLTGQAAGFADADIHGQLPEDLAELPILLLVPLVFLGTLFGAPLGEELGWRGYALPRMQAWLGPASAGLVVGLAWGAWHLPLFWMEFMAHADYSIASFMVNIVLASIVFVWLFNATGGSLLIVVLFHAVQNVVSGFAPISHHVSLAAAGATLVFILYMHVTGRLPQAIEAERA